MPATRQQIDRALAIAERVVRNVAAELEETPIYIIAPDETCSLSPGMIEYRTGCYYRDLDLAFQPWLESRNRWRGEGVAVIVDAAMYFDCCLDESIAERRILGTTLHEFAHYFDFAARARAATPAIAYEAFTDSIDNREQSQARSEYPLDLLGHSDSWQRLAVHLLYRSAHGGGYCLAPRYVTFGSDYAGLEYLPSPQRFIDALADEVVDLADLPLREIATIEQPPAFVALWDEVLRMFLPAHDAA